MRVEVRPGQRQLATLGWWDEDAIALQSVSEGVFSDTGLRPDRAKGATLVDDELTEPLWVSAAGKGFPPSGAGRLTTRVGYGADVVG